MAETVLVCPVVEISFRGGQMAEQGVRKLAITLPRMASLTRRPMTASRVLVTLSSAGVTESSRPNQHTPRSMHRFQ